MIQSKTVFQSALFTAAAFGLAACGDTPAKVGQGLDLQGEYQAAIREEFSLKVEGVGCVLYTVDVTANQLDYTQDIYKDKDCSKELIGTVKIDTNYKIGNELPNGQGRELNLEIDAATVTAKSDGFGEILGVDTTGECNIDDLKVNETRDVAGLNCVALGKYPAKGHVFYTAYRFDGEDVLMTNLPHELTANIGTNENPPPRATSTTIRFKKK